MLQEDIQALERFWQPAAAVRPEDPRSRGYFFVGANAAGVRVTHETAVQVATVWACIDVIAKAISSSDWLVYERQGPKKRRELDRFEDRLVYVLNVRPNPEMTAQACRRALMIAALSWGNGYGEIVRDRAGRVAELYPLAPDRVEPFRDRRGELKFEVKNDSGTATILEARDMYHVRGPSILGLMGDDMIAKASGTIALSIATYKFAQAYFGNSAHLGGIVEVPGGMDDPTFERLKAEFNANYKGVTNANKVAFIENGMKWHPMDADAEKSQLINARQQDVEDICRWFGVPPHKVQHLQRSTNNNIEHQGLEFTRDALRPWARELQQEADYKLISDRGPKRFTLIDLDWASEGDFKSRAEGLQILRNMGTLNGNEVRDTLGWDDMGPDGEKYIVQGAMTELKKVGQVYDKGKESPAEGDSKKDPESDALVAWLTSIYDRSNRCRLANPGKDHEQYLERQLVDILPHLTKFHDQAQPLAIAGGRAVFGGAPSDSTARETIMAIIGAAE